MKMVKRTVTLLLVCIMAISMFAGCGQTKETTTQETSAATAATATAASTAAEATAAETTAAAELGPVSLPLTTEKAEISLWYPFPPFFSQWFKSPDDALFWTELEKRTNVHIKFITVSTETARETFNLMVASGDYPDMVQNAAQLYTGGADKSVADGAFLKLNDLIKEKVPHLQKIIDSDAAYKKKVTTDGGNIAQFNQMVKNFDKSTNSGPQVRQDWLDELGIAMPVTYDDYYNMLKAFKEKKGADSALLLYRTGVPQNNYLAQGYGIAAQLDVANGVIAPFYQVDGKVKFGLVEPGFKEYVTMMNKWYTEGLVDQDFYSYKDNQMPKEDKIINNEAGLWYFDNVQMPTYIEKASATTPSFKLSGIPDAVKTAGDTLHLQFRQKEEAVSGFSVAANSKNVDIICKWMDYLYSDEGSLLCNWGVEGTSFTLVDGKPKYTEIMTKNPEGWPTFVCMNKYCLNYGPFYEDFDRSLDGLPDYELDAVSKWTSNSDTAYIISGSVSMTDAEGSEYSSKFSDIQTYASEMMIKFIIGKEPLTNFDKFTEQIKSMGIDDCIALWQAALDRYNAR